MMRTVQQFLLLCAVGVVGACSEIDTHYFKDRVNEATAERVAKRYGSPHKVEERLDRHVVWTYFDRGSANSGYAGTARSSFCRAYVLTFDREGTLRDWQQLDCRN
ncbi:MAG: hypothetical protein Q8L74_17450 [Nitrospirota bacterium]|nr:hypothetical protein [Nitrospirota bacterium]MDP2382939.1 hypothetical protein [Nitrospirota bacterium]MDP3597549.1 hypothetical protein [Nitrospirota bacterium]